MVNQDKSLEPTAGAPRECLDAAIASSADIKRWLRIVVVISMLFFLKAAAFAWLVTPLWAIPDEAGHYSYIEDLASGHYPVLGKATMGSDTARSWLGSGVSPRLNWIAQHPPLYYALDAPVVITARALGMNFGQQVRSARLLTAAFGALTLVGLALLVARAAKSLELGLAAAIFTAATPMFLHLSSGVTHDTLLACACAWAVERFFAWQGLRNRARLYTCAGFLAAACITKITALTLAVPLVAIIGVQLISSSEKWNVRLLDVAMVGLLTFLPVAIWMIHNIFVFGNPLVDARILQHTNPRVHIGPWEFATSKPFWQQTLINYVGMIGWSAGGALKIFEITGLPLRTFTAAIFLSSLMCIFSLAGKRFVDYGLLAFCTCLLITMFVFATQDQERTTAISCAVFAVAVLSACGYGIVRTLKSDSQLFALLFASLVVLFFSFLYFFRLWHGYDGVLRATQGRYVYPVLGLITLMMAWPWRMLRVERVGLVFAVFSMVLCDYFYLAQVFKFYDLNY